LLVFFSRSSLVCLSRCSLAIVRGPRCHDAKPVGASVGAHRFESSAAGHHAAWPTPAWAAPHSNRCAPTASPDPRSIRPAGSNEDPHSLDARSLVLEIFTCTPRTETIEDRGTQWGRSDSNVEPPTRKSVKPSDAPRRKTRSAAPPRRHPQALHRDSEVRDRERVERVERVERDRERVGEGSRPSKIQI